MTDKPLESPELRDPFWGNVLVFPFDGADGSSTFPPRPSTDNLHNTVTGALPDNGEWHTLTAMVRKVDGVFQVDELMLRRIPDEAD